ncbi:MAG: aldehyde dehydrogenase family protein [Marinilabiliales bacterium]|nr:aldehyde dehydrogenase family protein [Marinilabiliales bacterium]
MSQAAKCDPEGCYVEPTVIKDIRPDDPVMDEEIFGPLLPVIDYEDFQGGLRNYRTASQAPCRLYFHLKTVKVAGEFIDKTQSGTAAVNDTVIQIASPWLPYGGVGCSGMGKYHGIKVIRDFL